MILYLASLLFGAAGAVLAARLGPGIGLLDQPKARSSHTVPTPKGGGVGLLAAFIVGSWWSGLPAVFMAACAGV